MKSQIHTTISVVGKLSQDSLPGNSGTSVLVLICRMNRIFTTDYLLSPTVKASLII